MACVWCADALNILILSDSHPDKNGKVTLSTRQISWEKNSNLSYFPNLPSHDIFHELMK